MNVMLKNSFDCLRIGFTSGPQVQQVRHKFVGWRMLKDFRKRKVCEELGPERLRLISMKRNKILPPELQALASEELETLNRGATTALVSRCSVTSRARGTVKPYRISRIVFRNLADHNLLAGWQRARW